MRIPSRLRALRENPLYHFRCRRPGQDSERDRPCPFRPQYHTVSKVDAAATARGICARALDKGGLLAMDQGLPFGVPASVMHVGGSRHEDA